MLVHEAVEQAIAEEFVRLRGSPLEVPYVVWVTVQSPTVCAFCRRLDGVRRRLDETFPYDPALPWWGDHFGPPRHPNCRCILALGSQAFEDDPSPTLQAGSLQSQGVGASIDPIAQQAYDAWQTAGNQAAHHLYVTLRVSQDRPLAEVLAQPDVQAVLRRPFDHATDLTREAISEAWIEGAARGYAAGNQDLQIAGLEPSYPAEIDQDVLNRLLDDAGANGDAAYQRFRNAIQSQDPEAVREAVRGVTQAQALRARAGADVAGTTAFSLAKLAAFRGGPVGLTRVVVPPHPRKLPDGGITMVEGYSYDRASAALKEAVKAIGGIKGPSYTEELATKHIPASIAKGDALPTAMRVWRSDFINSTNMRAIAEGRKPAPAYERDLQLHFWALLLRDAVRDGEPLGHDTWRLESAMPPQVGDPVETTMRAVAKERSEAEGYLPTLLDQKNTVLYHLPPEARGVWYDDGREGIISGRFVVTSVRKEGDTWIAEVGPPKPPGRAGWARALGGVPTPTTEYRDEAHKRQAQGLKYAADTLETTPAKLKAKADKRVAEAIKGTHVAVRVDSSQLEQILDDGKLINRFQGAEEESGTRSDAGPWRELWEEAAFGLDPETPAEARPVYGYLAKDVATTQLKSGTPQGIGRYGDIAIRLKDEVRGRTSFTTDDSGAQNASTYEPGITDSELMPESIPQPVLAPSSEAFDWANERHYYETEEHDEEGVGGYTESHMETPLDYPDADEMLRGGGYYEAQVHGGVDLSDIEEVVFTVDTSTVEWNKTVEKLKRHLDALGIKWREQFQARLEPTEQRAEGGRTADYVFDYEPTPPPGRA